ncbi:MAG: 5-(carboxyamino)imidazole ribonucleotide synthase [Treponema sp.]|nr:5-(carboxyamino)imidazole ribonucleotide synthase [Treponema sp.]
MILPGKTIGIIGGGQLGRMMCLAAKAMGYDVAVLDPTANCPCGQVADIEITAGYDDMAAIKKLAEISDVITYEFENIDYDALFYLENNAYLPQGSDVLKITQHRYMEKKTISDMGIPVTEFFLLNSIKALEKHFFYPSVLKTTTGGYDGKGQLIIKSREDFEAAKKLAEKHECIIERWVPFDKEISVLIARSTSGETAVFPIPENIHVDNILHKSIVPASISDSVVQKAISYALQIAENLNTIGILAIEMFVAGDDVYINELAPRPHNSGHYTIDACITSQFEQHIRAICGLPLGDTSLHTPVVMVNILGEHLFSEVLDPYLPLLPRGKLHLYGKTETKEKRKMGHINMLGDIGDTLKLIEQADIWAG